MNKNKRIYIVCKRAVLAMLCTVACITVLHAQVGVGEKHLRAFYRDVQQYHAVFAQQVFDENLKEIERSQGRVWLSRPNRFRWDYAEPVSQLIVSDGKKLWVYDRDLEQVTIRNARTALARTPAELLASGDNLDASYRIKDLGRQGSLDWVELKPKQRAASVAEEGNSDYSRFRFGFEDGALRVLELVDGLEQTTRVSFMRRTSTHDAALFRFRPPPGVDVLDDSAR